MNVRRNMKEKAKRKSVIIAETAKKGHAVAKGRFSLIGLKKKQSSVITNVRVAPWASSMRNNLDNLYYSGAAKIEDYHALVKWLATIGDTYTTGEIIKWSHIQDTKANTMVLGSGDASVSEILSKYEVVEGNIKRFSPEQLKFVEFVAGRFEDLIEVMLIDERGYEDIWFVFPELGFDKSTGIISECLDYFKVNGQKEPEYLLLTPEGIVYEEHFPLVMLKLRG